MRLDLTRSIIHVAAMGKSLAYRWLVGALVALFFTLQSYSLSHASSYGDAPHEHDGVACSVTVLADDHVVVLPTVPVFKTVISDVTETAYPDFTSALYIRPQGRAPPPRGPPSAI